MAADTAKSFCLHSLDFRAEKTIRGGCEFPATQKASLGETVNVGGVRGTS